MLTVKLKERYALILTNEEELLDDSVIFMLL